MNLRFRTRDDIVFELMDTYKSVGLSRGNTSIDLDIVEKTFMSGGVFIGERRIETQEISLTVEFAFDTDEGYRDAYNNLAYYAQACEYIEDTDNNIRTKVECSSISDNPDSNIGTTSRTGQAQITFTQLTPYWEDLTESTDSDTGTDLTFNLTNQGYLDTPPKFEIIASALCQGFAIYMTTPKRGIEIQDLNFGSNTTLDNYEIDCNEGTALIGDDLINRNDRIRGGSGFFDFPVGSFTLYAEFSASCSITITWRNRYYI